MCLSGSTPERTVCLPFFDIFDSIVFSNACTRAVTLDEMNEANVHLMT